MIGPFKASYSYDYNIINEWNSSAIGVYYCGIKTTNNELTIYYIGRAVGEDGIRGRLLQHLNETKWHDVSHFGYHVCDTAQEAKDFEAAEIEKYKPKYNTHGK